ncbi:ATP-binding protein [Kordiimonas sp.]|uniref:ATP-binding protein n=1 Tax=Kordiimonas sp. TaxID=1970157 RepID=UPI003A9287E3
MGQSTDISGRISPAWLFVMPALLGIAVFISAFPFPIIKAPVNLLHTACYFYTDTLDEYPKMGQSVAQEKCDGLAEPSRNTVWLSIDAAPLSPETGTEYSLVLFRHWLEGAAIQFRYADGTYVSYNLGPYDFDRYWSVGNFVTFDAPARGSAVEHIYVGLENPSSIKLFRQLNFVKAEDWNKREVTGHLIISLIIGALLAMLLYNISLAATLRFDFHLQYCLFVASIFVYTAVAYGAFAHFLPGILTIGQQMNITILALGLNGLTGLLFLQAFIEKSVFPPWWHQFIKIAALPFGLWSVFYVSTRGWHADTIDLIFNLLALGGISVILVSLVVAIPRGSRSAIFYAAGWLLPIIGVGVRVLRGLDVIPHSAFVEFFMPIGMALETVILSIGIADRIVQIRAERDAAQRASEQARAANEAKSDFLARMSHEIRTPLNAVIGLSELTATTNLNEKQRGYINNIKASGDILLTLINDILDFSKIEAGKLDLEHMTFRPAAVLDVVKTIVEPKALEKGLAFTVTGQEQLPEQLCGDPTRLSQVLINLGNNAIKFTEAGAVTIAVSCTSAVEGKARFSCTVTDTGIGMSPEEQSRLFQSFSQVDETITRRYGGTGLGLAICKQLVELMHGEISVKSLSGKGSVFSFNILLDLPREAKNREAAIAPAPPASPPSVLAGTHILLAEDNPVNRIIAIKLLTEVGVIVDIAEDGLIALEKGMQSRYDAILMDMQMPGMDGVAVTRALRQTDGGARVPIIAMTANVSMADREHCLKAGMNDHIPKPFKPEMLYSTLTRWLV